MQNLLVHHAHRSAHSHISDIDSGRALHHGDGQGGVVWCGAEHGQTRTVSGADDKISNVCQLLLVLLLLHQSARQSRHCLVGCRQ